jgi:hypothetical protein
MTNSKHSEGRVDLETELIPESGINFQAEVLVLREKVQWEEILDFMIEKGRLPRNKIEKEKKMSTKLLNLSSGTILDDSEIKREIIILYQELKRSGRGITVPNQSIEGLAEERFGDILKMLEEGESPKRGTIPYNKLRTFIKGSKNTTLQNTQIGKRILDIQENMGKETFRNTPPQP